MLKLAARAPPGCEGLLMLPHMLSERAPLWDSISPASTWESAPTTPLSLHPRRTRRRLPPTLYDWRLLDTVAPVQFISTTGRPFASI
jgi:hypothetical protein